WADDHRDADVQHGQSSSTIAGQRTWFVKALNRIAISASTVQPFNDLTSEAETIFAVSNFKIDGLICAAWTKNEPMRGNRTASRASRLIQSLPRYILAKSRANSCSADGRSSPPMIFLIAPAASSPERSA